MHLWPRRARLQEIIEFHFRCFLSLKTKVRSPSSFLQSCNNFNYHMAPQRIEREGSHKNEKFPLNITNAREVGASKVSIKIVTFRTRSCLHRIFMKGNADMCWGY